MSTDTPERPEPLMRRWRNHDGTYDGATMMADLTGLSRAEIVWTWTRLGELLKSGMNKHEAMAAVKEQAKSKPWISSNPT